MSKSRGNVVNPDDVVNEYGADTLRLYEMFIGDFEKAAPWDPKGIKGCRRLVERFYNLAENVIDSDEIRSEVESDIHKAIKKVDEDIETLKFNTAIACLMSLINIFGQKGITKGELRIFAILLNPFAPHVSEEVWEIAKLGEGMVAEQKWPEYDEAKCKDETVEIAVQVNGKIKARLNISADADNTEAIAAAKSDAKVAAAIDGMNIVKEIYVKGKLVNIVVKPR